LETTRESSFDFISKEFCIEVVLGGLFVHKAGGILQMVVKTSDEQFTIRLIRDKTKPINLSLKVIY